MLQPLAQDIIEFLIPLAAGVAVLILGMQLSQLSKIIRIAVIAIAIGGVGLGTLALFGQLSFPMSRALVRLGGETVCSLGQRWFCLASS